MLNVESAIKTHSLKAPQHQPSRQTTAADRAPSTFESMLDDNAANASTAAKEKDKPQSAATDRTQKGPEPKAKSDKPVTENKAAADQPDAKAAPVEKPADAENTVETPVVAATPGEAETDVPVEVSSDTAPETDTAAAETAVPTPAVNAAPVVPIHTLTPADAQPAQPQDSEEAATQAPAIAAVTGQKPVETIGQPGKTVEGKDSDKPNDAEQPAKAEQTAQGDQSADATQTAAQPQEQASAEKGKAPHVALSDAEKEHIARARGEGVDKTEKTSASGKSDQTDGGPTVQKATADVPTQQVQAPTTHAASNITAATAPAAAPQTTAQAAAVPLSGVGVEIASKATSGAKEFEIRLDPPELGRIEVRLNVDRDGNVTSRLIADRQDTLDLLKRDSSGLERALQDAGLKTSDNGMQFSLRDQSFAQQQNDGNSKSSITHVVVPDETLPTADIPVQSYGRLAGRSGGLDIRV